MRHCRTRAGAEIRIVGGLLAVFKPVAVVGERVVPLAVVLLQARKVQVGGLDQFFPRNPLSRRHRFKKRRARFPELLEFGRSVASVNPGAHHNVSISAICRFAILRRIATDTGILASFMVPRNATSSGPRIVHKQPVGALCGSGSPKTVTRLQTLAILRILDRLGQRRQLGIVRNQGVHVLVDKPSRQVRSQDCANAPPDNQRTCRYYDQTFSFGGVLCSVEIPFSQLLHPEFIPYGARSMIVLNLMDLALLNLEELGDLPRPQLRWARPSPCGHRGFETCACPRLNGRRRQKLNISPRSGSTAT